MSNYVTALDTRGNVHVIREDGPIHALCSKRIRRFVATFTRDTSTATCDKCKDRV